MSSGSFVDPNGNHIGGVIILGLAQTAGNGAKVGDAVPIGQNGTTLAVSGAVGGGGTASAGPSAATGATSTNAVPVQDAATGAALGLDSSLQSILTALSGGLKVFGGNNGALALDATLTGGNAKVQVTNLPTTQQVSAASLPLPTGAAQDNTLTSGAVKAQVTALPPIPAGANAIGSVSVSNLPATQAVSAAALPLPAGAAQDATLTSGAAKVQVTALPALPAGSAAIGSVNVSNLPATQAVSGSVSVANFPATQAVSVGNFPATQPVSAAALPLPSGAATDANLASILTKLNGIVRTAPPSGPVTAGSATATSSTVNTPIALFAAGAIVNGWCVQNPPGTGANIVVDIGGGTYSAPVTPIVLQPGQTLAPNFNPTNAVNVWSASASIALVSGKW
jgi:hypothetical protein